jgi:DNA-binding Lrp family transcriptional regulator
MDKIDRFLLAELQKDASQSAASLGEKVGLSASPCARRIRQLEEQGYVKGVHARVNAKALGYQMTVFVHVRLSLHQENVVMQFEQSVDAMEQVLSCFTVSGSFDYLLQVKVKDLTAYEAWVKQLQRLPMVSQIDSSFAIRTIKENAPLPV